MKFKEAYSLMLAGKRLICPTVTMQNPCKPLKYLTAGRTTNFIEDKLVSAQNFIVVIDQDDKFHVINEKTLLEFLLNEDNDWSEYIETEIETIPVPSCLPISDESKHCGECQC